MLQRAILFAALWMLVAGRYSDNCNPNWSTAIQYLGVGAAPPHRLHCINFTTERQSEHDFKHDSLIRF